MPSVEKLKKQLDQILLTYRDHVQSTWDFNDYELSLQGSELYFEVDIEGEKRQIKGRASNWIILCSTYWAATFTKEMYSIYSKGSIPTLLRGSIDVNESTQYEEMYRDERILNSLVEIGNYFLNNGEKEEAEQCFWAALSEAHSADDGSPNSFYTLLVKVPEQFRESFTQAYDVEFLHDDFWQGRNKISRLVGAKSAAGIIEGQLNFLGKWRGLENFLYSNSNYGPTNSNVTTGKAVLELLTTHVLPLTLSKLGTIQYMALRCTEMCVLQVFTNYVCGGNVPLILYQDSLPCLDRLLEFGIGLNKHLRYQWEALVAIKKYEEAENKWEAIKITSPSAMMVAADMFNQGDLMEWRSAALTRAANAILSQKKLNQEEIEYADKLSQEAITLVNSFLQEKKLQKTTKGFYAYTFKVVGKLRELQKNYPESLQAYEKAKELEKKLGLEWREKYYDEDIERITKKIK